MNTRALCSNLAQRGTNHAFRTNAAQFGGSNFRQFWAGKYLLLLPHRYLPGCWRAPQTMFKVQSQPPHIDFGNAQFICVGVGWHSSTFPTTTPDAQVRRSSMSSTSNPASVVSANSSGVSVKSTSSRSQLKKYAWIVLVCSDVTPDDLTKQGLEVDAKFEQRFPPLKGCVERD